MEKTKFKIIDINQYLYYFPQKQIIFCSDKLFNRSDINLIPNEIKINENEFTCMINLNNDYNNNDYINISLNIMKPISDNSNKDSLDVYLGDSLIFKKLIFKNNKEKLNENFYKKNFIVNIKNNRYVYFLKENNNNINNHIDDFLNLNFQAAENSLFKGNHLLLNLRLNEVNKGLSFVEKKTKVKLNEKVNTKFKNENETNSNSNSKI
jgi:hypothetical protein